VFETNRCQALVTCQVCYHLLMSDSLSATKQSFSSLTSRYSTRPSRRKSSKLLDNHRKHWQLNVTIIHTSVTHWLLYSMHPMRTEVKH